jgi:CBS domain-containing protein
MLVRELMTPNPVTVQSVTPVNTALRLLAENRITSMPVLDQDGRLRGVVSEADLIRDLVGPAARAHERPLEHDADAPPQVVADVMSAHTVEVGPDDDVADAVELMTTTTVKSLPVVSHGVLVGMVSRGDVVRVMAKTDQQIALEVDSLLDSVGLGDWIADVSDGRVLLTGPEHSEGRTVAEIVASTVPGVVRVEVS